MILPSATKAPQIAPCARIAPNAVISGDVTIGENCSVGYGAVIVAESGSVSLGKNVVVMDTAVIRGVHSSPVTIGDNVLIGPRAYLSGCTIKEEVFLATGATVFNAAIVGARSEVRINGLVHLRTTLPRDCTVPIGWVAVGDPVQILPPGAHDEIWAAQEPLDFPHEVFRVARPLPGQTFMSDLMPRYAASLRKRHVDDCS